MKYTYLKIIHMCSSSKYNRASVSERVSTSYIILYTLAYGLTFMNKLSNSLSNSAFISELLLWFFR